MSIPSVREMIARLVAEPSVSSVHPDFDQGNRAVIGHLADWLADLGFRVEIQGIARHPDKANLIATLGPDSEDGLILSGHTDTVPCDPELWSNDPFTLTERDGRLYGLGSADMKSYLPLVIEAVRTLDPKRLTHPLVVLATADEESSMDGAQALVDTGRRLGRYAVIGEPTSLKPIRMHKGIVMDRVTLTGRAGHSSNPALGVSALEGMNHVMSAILEWRDAIQKQHRNAGFEVPFPTLNLGHIHGGDNPNRICGHCELHYDMRLLPGMDNEQQRADLLAHLQRRLGDSELRLVMDALFAGVPPFETRADSPIVQACEELSGHPAGAVAFATEGPFFSQLDIQTVVCGPGDIDQAHQPDEYLRLDQLQPCIDMTQGLIKRFCLS
ncbi:MAG: acetylornithine deacetylase [Gammaproteobacteria bacterium]|nr:acetylornithine deacetylase [Gammaproteobacteria bacterium]MCP5136745.1 acetylornithine deacetylase [Gammaproteobacteria bacterium]